MTTFSFDHDASMSRGADRQKVIEDQYRKFYDFVEAQEGKGHTHQTWFTELHIALLTLLVAHDGVTYPAMIASRERDIRNFVSDRVAEIKSFAPAKEEWRHMVHVLSEKLLNSAVIGIVAEFSAWESKAFRH